MIRTTAIGLAAIVWVEVQPSAQTPAAPVAIAQCAVRDPTVLADLTSAYESGNAGSFEDAAARILTFVRRCPTAEGADRALLATIDLRSDYVLLAWPGSDTFSERILFSAVVHAGDGPHGRTLPGGRALPGRNASTGSSARSLLQTSGPARDSRF
ncbi:MAG: hypothetical protein V7647_3367 [Acidobacteriota bacterium]